MSILQKILGGKSAAITSDAIRSEIEHIENEIAEHRARLHGMLANLAIFTDGEHAQAEADAAAINRAVTRLEARANHLVAELPAVIAAEESAAKVAADNALRKRAEAARKATTDESRKLLERYGSLAKQMAEVFARQAEIDAETGAVNDLLRYNPVAPNIASYAMLHRKAPDREASETNESRRVWTFSDGYSETALINADGSVRPHDPHWGFQEERFLVGTLVQREIVVGRTDFRPGAYLEDFSAVRLPPAFWGDNYYWPRKS